MRKLFIVGVLVLAMSGLAIAQDFPKFEVFGGYSYLRSNLNNNNPFVSEYYGSDVANMGYGKLNGFEGSFTYNLNQWLGIKADFSGHFGKSNMDYSSDYENIYYDEYYGSSPYYDYTVNYEQRGTADVKHYTYLFGPEFSYRGNSTVRPFAHVLFGFSKADIQEMRVDFTELDFYNQVVNQTPYGYYYVGTVTGAFSNTSFAMALGGGLDINVGDHFAIRLAQLDYLPTYHDFKGRIETIESQYSVPDTTTGANGTLQWSRDTTDTVRLPNARFNNLRLSAGIVLKF